MVPERAQLIGLGEPLQGAAFPRCAVRIDFIDYRWVQHEKAAIDPAAVAQGLLNKPVDAILVDIERAVAARWLHCGDRGALAVGTVKRQ